MRRAIGRQVMNGVSALAVVLAAACSPGDEAESLERNTASHRPCRVDGVQRVYLDAVVGVQKVKENAPGYVTLAVSCFPTDENLTVYLGEYDAFSGGEGTAGSGSYIHPKNHQGEYELNSGYHAGHDSRYADFSFTVPIPTETWQRLRNKPTKRIGYRIDFSSSDFQSHDLYGSFLNQDVGAVKLTCAKPTDRLTEGCVITSEAPGVVEVPASEDPVVTVPGSLPPDAKKCKTWGDGLGLTWNPQLDYDKVRATQRFKAVWKVRNDIPPASSVTKPADKWREDRVLVHFEFGTKLKVQETFRALPQGIFYNGGGAVEIPDLKAPSREGTYTAQFSLVYINEHNLSEVKKVCYLPELTVKVAPIPLCKERLTLKVRPQEAFTAEFPVENNSQADWTSASVDYRFISGRRMQPEDEDLGNLAVDIPVSETRVVSIPLTAPRKVKTYAALWRLEQGGVPLCDLPLTVIVTNNTSSMHGHP